MVRVVSYIAISLVTLCSLFGQCAKFDPGQGKRLLILGQDLGAIGGFNSPDNSGYYEEVGGGVAGGITTYTSLPSLNGLESMTNYGAGNVCAQCIVDNPIYDNSVLAIGLYMVNQLQKISSGAYDGQIDILADWVKATNRPVFLRIGYEFEYQYGGDDPNMYISAYKRIVDRFREKEVDNCAYVWQAAAGTGAWSQLSQWYPGDDYVDWFGYSHFKYDGKTMIDKARQKGKPVMIAEATPMGWNLDEVNGNFVWNSWFKPMFEHIEENADVIKALAYINQDWEKQWLWAGQNWGNSRVQDNSIVLEKWNQELAKPNWVMASGFLFSDLPSCEVASSIKEINRSIYLFPNPTTGLISAGWGPGAHWDQAVVRDLEGRDLLIEEIEAIDHVSIDCKDLQPGTYTLTLSGESDPYTQSFIKL